MTSLHSSGLCGDVLEPRAAPSTQGPGTRQTAPHLATMRMNPGNFGMALLMLAAWLRNHVSGGGGRRAAGGDLSDSRLWINQPVPKFSGETRQPQSIGRGSEL